MTPSGIEVATFRVVAQHLNHSATAVPQIFTMGKVKFTVEQATKAQRGSRGIALLFL
jgi:hypothetical protein